MSDHYSARIGIGGDLPRRHLARLCGLLGCGGRADAEALLERVDDGALRHEDPQAAWGEFDDLEAACRELGLPYVRYSEGHWETPPQYAFWLPGMEGPESAATDCDSNLLARMDTLCEVRGHLRAGRAAEALALLDGTIVEVPALPPFRIV